MKNFPPPWPTDFDSLARQYWSSWGELMRQAAPTPTPQAAPGFQQALQWWAQLLPQSAPQDPLQQLMAKFQQHAGDWYGQMQQLAAQFSGQSPSPADVSQAWREVLGATGQADTLAEMFTRMLGQGGHAAGMDGWYQQAKPWLDALEHENARWLHVPTFGLAREHQHRWQGLALAQQDYQHQVNEFNALMARAAQRAFEVFEQKLAGHAQSGESITRARALFDLWIDAAEQSYAEIAMSDDYRHVYGALANAQMRLRLAVQKEVEQVSEVFGMPTRTEVDAAHRKIVELERQLRRLKTAAAEPPGRAPKPSAPESVEPKASAVRGKRASVSAAKPAAVRRASVKKAATKKVAMAPAPAGKVHPPAAKAKPDVATRKAKPATRKSAPAGARGSRRMTAAAPSVSTRDWVVRNQAAAITAAKPTGKRSGRGGKRK